MQNLTSHALPILSGIGVRNVSGPFQIEFSDCVLPISGQYGFLPRVLFYLLLVFGIVFRSHEWLATGALVSSMIYSGSATVHVLIATTITGKASVGVDLIPIASILSASCSIAIPLFNWSSTLRRLPSRIVIVYWDILVSAGLAATGVLIYIKHKMPGSRAVGLPNTTFIDCEADRSGFLSLPLLIETRWLANHQCTNPCASTTIEIPFRCSDIASSLSLTNYYSIPTLGSSSQEYYCLLILPFLALQSPYFCIIGRATPSQVRGKIFASLYHRRNEERWTGVVKKLFARSIATILYLTAILMLLSCPCLFVLLVIVQEYDLAHNPNLQESESLIMVGQWSPWVGGGLVLTGAVITRYHDSWIERLYSIFKGSVARLRAFVQS